MDLRIAERRAEVRRDRQRRRRRRTLTALVLAVIFGLGALVERSSLVALAEVEVAGTAQVSDEEIRAAAALPIGTSSLRLRLGPVADRVGALPEIRRADARRVDPLTVRIDVVERRPALALVATGGALLVDDEGVVLRPGSADGFPRLLVSGPLPEVGERLDRGVAGEAYDVYASLPGPLRTQVTAYVAERSGEVALVLLDGTTVHFGRPDRIMEKARVLGALLEEVEVGAGWSIDVRAPGAPVVAAPAE